MQPLTIIPSVDGKEGYTTQFTLEKEELAIIYKMIQIQWLYRLQLLVPNQVIQFQKLGMERYHELAHLVDHAVIWTKHSRVFPIEAVEIIRNMNFFKKLEKELGAIHIADEENLGWENIYWRLVRPGNSDIGSLHADKWFWDIGDYWQPTNFPYRRLKMWIAIATLPEKNGLYIVPGSHHKKDWHWYSEERLGKKKPIFGDKLDGFNLTLLPLKAGESVIFHDELLHGGAPNTAETSRVSIEFTILIPNKTKQTVALNQPSLESV